MTYAFGPDARNYRHGHKPQGKTSGEYASWNAIRARCHNKKNPNYPRYGGRGIKVCERWRYSFMAFLEDMGLKPTPQHSIERKDNGGNYEPSNCRWATKVEQANNRSTNRILEFKGEKRTLAQWAAFLGWPQHVLDTRLRKGWTVERALTQPRRVLIAGENGSKGTYRCPAL